MISSICTTGASMQQPRQATRSAVYSPSPSVLDPAGMFRWIPECVVDGRSAGDVAGGPGAGLDDVPPDGLETKLGVEGRDPGDLLGRDFADLGHPLERSVREVVVELLDRLQDGHEILRARTDAGDDLVDRRAVEAVR